jgi:microcystin-dependent protein
MATDKLFTVVGTSKFGGETKVRFANDTLRTKVLQKHDHTDINLVELDRPMTKLEAVLAIKSGAEFASAACQAAIADYLDRNQPTAKTPKAAPAPKAVKAPAKATAKVTEDEDASF